MRLCNLPSLSMAWLSHINVKSTCTGVTGSLILLHFSREEPVHEAMSQVQCF